MPAQTPSPNTRFVGRQLRFPTEFITAEVFFHLQVMLRHLVDLSFKLFTNAMVLTSGDNRGLVSLVKDGINIVWYVLRFAFVFCHFYLQ